MVFLTLRWLDGSWNPPPSWEAHMLIAAAVLAISVPGLWLAQRGIDERVIRPGSGDNGANSAVGAAGITLAISRWMALLALLAGIGWPALRWFQLLAGVLMTLSSIPGMMFPLARSLRGVQVNLVTAPSVLAILAYLACMMSGMFFFPMVGLWMGDGLRDAAWAELRPIRRLSCDPDGVNGIRAVCDGEDLTDPVELIGAQCGTEIRWTVSSGSGSKRRSTSYRYTPLQGAGGQLCALLEGSCPPELSPPPRSRPLVIVPGWPLGTALAGRAVKAGWRVGAQVPAARRIPTAEEAEATAAWGLRSFLVSYGLAVLTGVLFYVADRVEYRLIRLTGHRPGALNPGKALSPGSPGRRPRSG